MTILSLIITPGVHAAPVTVQINPSSQIVPQGTIASYTIGLSGAGLGPPPNYDGYLLSLSGLIPGAGYSFSSSRVSTSSGSGSAGLTIDASSTPLFCPGIYPFIVTATNSTGPGDSGSASGSLTVVQVGPSLVFQLSTDKPTYRIGDKVTITDSSNRPAEAHVTVTPPSGSSSVVYDIFYGSSTFTHTYTANVIGRYTVNIQGDDFCNIFNSATVYFDVTPNTFDVSVSIGGVSPQISVPLTIDGQSQGTIAGGEIKSLSFPLATTHTITVAPSVDGGNGVRYTCAQNTWTVSSAGSQTFQYAAQYLFTVGTDPDGVTQVTGGGWFNSGATVQTSQAADTVAGPPGTKYVFQGWTVDGAAQSGNPITLTMDKPHTVVAVYQTEYQLVVDSTYGNPQGSGYYQSGSTATFSVTSPSGFLIQQVFTAWTGGYTGNSPSGSITMDKPYTVHANWQTSYLQLEILLVALIAIAVVAGLLLWRRGQQGAPPPETKPTPPMPGESSSGVSQSELTGQTIKCSSCGTDVPTGQNYCQNCGSKIT